MATDIVQGLFGMTPESYQQQRDAEALQRAAAFGQMSPMEAARTSIFYGANKLGNVVGGMLGAEDPQMRLISQRNALAKQFDVSTPEGIAQYGQALQQVGDTQGALGAIGISRQMTQEMALAAQRKAAERASLATAAKTELSIDQEKKLRDELSKLGPNATNDQVLSIVSQYGSPDKVLAVLQASADRTAQRENALQMAKDKLDANIQMAKDRGATQMQIAEMQIEGRKQIAELVASLKGPSAALIKAEEKAAKIAEGKEGLSDTVTVAKTLVEDLAKMGGMTSTAKGPLANLVTSLGTGTVGQIGGRLVGTETQAKRDELKSVRLQLLNAVKEATGMSATQLNSNVELKTWLDSLGGEGMTKEANLAILNNISNRYLKGTGGAPSGNAPMGTAANPIKLK